MIKHTRYRANKTTKKRVDPLFMAVIAMLVFVPIINACSTAPRPKTTKTQINTANIDTKSLQLPDGYEWDSDNDEDDEDDDAVTSDFQQGVASTFKADENAPTSTRLSAIEDQLSLLRNDFNELYPSMRRLMAIEQDMQELIMELKSLTTDVAAQAPMPTQQNTTSTFTGNEGISHTEQTNAITPAAMPTPQAITDITQPPTINTSNAAPASGPITATVTGTRIGIHSDIVRVVLDYTHGSTVTFDKLSGDRIFKLTLANTQYEGRKTWRSEFVPMVTSYTAQQNGADATITFNLEQGARLKSAFIIPAKSDGKAPRLVIDFAQ